MKADKIKLIIFDLDGTLVDAYKAVTVSVNATLRKLGYPALSHNEIKKRVGWGDKELLQRIVFKKDLGRALALYRRHHGQALLKRTCFLPWANFIVKKLKVKKFTLAIATNRPTRYTHIILRHLKLSKYFDYVLCADKCKKGKPSPEILRRILKRYSLKVSEALYVGDMAIDVKTGNRMNMRTVAVLTGSSSKREIFSERPFKLVKNLNSLMKIVDQINA